MDMIFSVVIALIICRFAQGQAANQPPVWVEDSLSSLRNGISEDVPVLSIIGELKCIDPDDNAVQYSVDGGDTIAVSAFTGVVRLTKQLEFETNDPIGIDVKVTCTDIDEFGSPIHNPVPVEFRLTVNDANDEKPEFSNKDKYNMDISEAAEPGFVLKPSIIVTDADRTINAELSAFYLICNSPLESEKENLPETSIATCEKFELTYVLVDEGEYKAEIILKEALDFETRQSYSSILVAIDNAKEGAKKHKVTTNIQIKVIDAQDMDPIFLNLGESTVVSEGAKMGDPVSMAVSGRDGDSGDLRPLKFTMVSDPHNAFSFDPPVNVGGVYSASLRVNNSLDREAIVGAYEFVVKITEVDKKTGAETDATATATYSVQISDVDDEPPIFEQETYYVDVTEMEYTTDAVQITGLRMVCTDADESQHAKYNVRIVSQTQKDVFSISPALNFTGTAILYLTVERSQFIDYDNEEYRNQTVVVEAKSTGNVPLSSTTTVFITVTDINDNRPEFKEPSYSLKIKESISVDQLPYDFDTIIEAVDQDSGTNGVVEYRLEGGTSDKFEINPRTGVLSLVRTLDYEETPSYVFLVFASDKATQDRQTSQVQVTVEVVNVNDMPPVFQQPSYQTTVNEDQIRFLTPIEVDATDNEEGTGTIFYKIIKGQTEDFAFQLGQVSGSLTLNRKLDYGTNGIYDLVIEASDNGIPPQTATVPVQISVIDQNNFAPVVFPKKYENEFPESVSPGEFVTTINGTDRDKGDFGKITYRIEEGGFDNFVIDPETGEVRINDPQNFDFDVQKFYKVRIIATDAGAPQLSDEATIEVTITDANNKRPKFTDSIYLATVDEKENVNFNVLTIFARDDDSSKKLVYSIQEQSITARNGAGNLLNSIDIYNYREAFGINGENGEIYIKNKLDKEKALTINFIAQVEDTNAETSNQIDTTRVAITITGDANTDLSFDVFSQSFINEGSPVSYDITTIRARDPTNQEGIKNYVEIGSNKFFEVVQSTGQIRLKNKVDYESPPNIHRIVIMAIADDGIRSASTTLTIKVNDDNDNVPVFDKPEYTAFVDEDAPALFTVASISATDEDTLSYGPIEYEIAGGLDSDHFKLYKTARGVDVYVARGDVLDYNNRDYYELDIIAKDNPKRMFSNVQQVSTVKLKITVVDKNNHKPKFLEEAEIRKLAVAETVPISTSVGTIVATDDDFGKNGEITFDLIRSDDTQSLTGLQLFTIVPKVGIITTAASLVGFGGNNYRLRVFARDGGSPFLSNTLDVEIEVLTTENNDGNPIWYRPTNNFVFYAPEEKSDYVIKNRGSEIIFEVAPRTGNKIEFSLSDKSDSKDSFHINETTGVITVVKPLDREIKEEYKLLVYAADTANTTFIRAGRQIIIKLTDIDDNSPTFLNPKNYPQCGSPIERPIDIHLYENVDSNVTIYTLRACDPDFGSTIYYYPYNGNDYCRDQNAASIFEILENGRVMPTTLVDYEVKHEYPMCAIAVSVRQSGRSKRSDEMMNHVDSSLENVAYLYIHIRDQNDNGPHFPKREVSGVMITDARDLPIVLLDAFDADGKGLHIPIYTILETKFYPAGSNTPMYPGRAFVMENNELHPDPPRGFTFQDFARGRFVLTIQAEDPVNPDFTDTQIVTVYVYERGQAMKVILNMLPSEGIKVGEQIVTDLNGVSADYAFRYLHVSLHEDKDGIDAKKTDVCFIAVDANSHNILTIFELVNLLAKSKYQTVLSDDDYQQIDRAKCYPSRSSEEQVKWRDLWWVLVIVAIFIAFCTLVFIVIIFFMHRRYKRYMETEKTYLVPQ